MSSNYADICFYEKRVSEQNEYIDFINSRIDIDIKRKSELINSAHQMKMHYKKRLRDLSQK